MEMQITIREAATRLHEPIPFVQKLIRAGVLRCAKIDGRMMVPLADVELVSYCAESRLRVE